MQAVALAPSARARILASYQIPLKTYLRWLAEKKRKPE